MNTPQPQYLMAPCADAHYHHHSWQTGLRIYDENAKPSSSIRYYRKLCAEDILVQIIYSSRHECSIITGGASGGRSAEGLWTTERGDTPDSAERFIASYATNAS